MIRLIDTYSRIPSLFENASFVSAKWEAYINSIYPDSARIFREDADEYIQSGNCTFEGDLLPLLNAVCGNPRLDELHTSFLAVTEGLNAKIAHGFGGGIDIDIVLYLGLCNAAGWVTRINGRDTVLLGVEKIIELDWCDPDSMRGLILHELGHAYHAQHGHFACDSADGAKKFVWQLFTEGVAMYFEQVLVGDTDYYHQDRNGWKAWCAAHFQQILADFDADLPVMTRFDQRYFGDWVNYCGHGDVGYYLGARFVHCLLEKLCFADLIRLDADAVYHLYRDFARRRA